jgi:hypothetical protein
MTTSTPPRRPVVPAEATQELRAADVVGVLGSFESGGVSTAGVALPRKSLNSQSSIAPVGLDLARGAGAAADTGEDDDVLDNPVATALPARRRRLGKIVFGAVAACAAILIAAGIARIGHASGEPSASAATSNPAANGAAPGSTATPATAAATAAAAAPASIGAAAPDPASAGTVRLARPTLAGHVWLDGKKVSASSVIVSCGTHQLKVGHGRKHSIDVPCGGEIAVGK